MTLKKLIRNKKIGLKTSSKKRNFIRKLIKLKTKEKGMNVWKKKRNGFDI